MANKVSSSQEPQEKGCYFEWDENYQLYFHASSGFYHDPNAGWYYSSKDGLYYSFENGNYELLDSGTEHGTEVNQCADTLPKASTSCEPCRNSLSGYKESVSDHQEENAPPPSEWLEETLINLYLSGYTNPYADGMELCGETHDGVNFSTSVDGDGEAHELEEGEWIPEEHSDDLTRSISYEGVAWDEENWRAQYGQVTQSGGELVPTVPFLDLWDWAKVTEHRNDGKGQVERLIGRLVKRSTKLHPSMPAGSRLFKTAPICESHLDLVRVKSGKVYKLRTPSIRYLATVSSFDSSNPTQDWGFASLSSVRQPNKSSMKQKSTAADEVHVCKYMPMPPDQSSASDQQSNSSYRDRAAERRALHGGFGVGPGQKIEAVNSINSPPSGASDCREEAAEEALNMSLGVGSYGRRMLKSMGWKEGEALGNTTKGLKEPLQVVGNTGNAGVGWAHARKRPR